MSASDENLSRLRTALLLVNELNDREQSVIDEWFGSGWRTWLYNVGISDDIIGPHRSDIEDHDNQAPPLSDEQRRVAPEIPYPKLVEVIEALRDLSKNEFDAIMGIWAGDNRGFTGNDVKGTFRAEANVDFGTGKGDFTLGVSNVAGQVKFGNGKGSVTFNGDTAHVEMLAHVGGLPESRSAR